MGATQNLCAENCVFAVINPVFLGSPHTLRTRNGSLHTLLIDRPLIISQLEKQCICGIGKSATAVDHDTSVQAPQVEIDYPTGYFSDGPRSDIAPTSNDGKSGWATTSETRMAARWHLIIRASLPATISRANGQHHFHSCSAMSPRTDEPKNRAKRQ
jgi:hypothetical protein